MGFLCRFTHQRNLIMLRASLADYYFDLIISHVAYNITHSFHIDIRKRDGLATLLLSIFYLQLSTTEANIAQLVW